MTAIEKDKLISRIFPLSKRIKPGAEFSTLLVENIVIPISPEAWLESETQAISTYAPHLRNTGKNTGVVLTTQIYEGLYWVMPR